MAETIKITVTKEDAKDIAQGLRFLAHELSNDESDIKNLLNLAFKIEEQLGEKRLPSFWFRLKRIFC